MSHHIQYWTRERAEIAFRSNERVPHLESGWFSGLRPDDVLWILTSTGHGFDMVLAIRARVRSVEELNTHPDYAVGNSTVFRNFRAHFYPDETTSPCRVPVPESQLRRLRFESSGGVKSLGDGDMGEILAGPLASRRRLTDDGADLLEELWEANASYPWA
jgi:hypothetical protein